jgi:hypothetical protein
MIIIKIENSPGRNLPIHLYRIIYDFVKGKLLF